MKRYWFKAKRYGWGWYPGSWQGWLVLGIYLLLVFLDFHRIDSQSHSVSDVLINFIPNSFILTILLIVICYLTGEKPGWRWGDKKKT